MGELETKIEELESKLKEMEHQLDEKNKAIALLEKKLKKKWKKILIQIPKNKEGC